MFNFSGSELVFLLILGLVILGPEKLPGAIRKAGRLYGEFRRITSDAQSEFREAFREPMQEIQQTARGYKQMFTDAVVEGSSDTTDSVETSDHAPEVPTEPSDHSTDPTSDPTTDATDVTGEGRAS